MIFQSNPFGLSHWEKFLCWSRDVSHDLWWTKNCNMSLVWFLFFFTFSLAGFTAFNRRVEEDGS